LDPPARKRWKEAVLKRIIAAEPGNADALKLIGYSLRRSGDCIASSSKPPTPPAELEWLTDGCSWNVLVTSADSS
jgi:hypothetical protein